MEEGRARSFRASNPIARADDQDRQSTTNKTKIQPAITNLALQILLLVRTHCRSLNPFKVNLDLDPAKSGPYITCVGNCAIVIGFERIATVAWKLVRSVVESLLELCFQPPLASKGSGGMMVSKASKGALSPFPTGLEVTIYEEREI